MGYLKIQGDYLEDKYDYVADNITYAASALNSAGTALKVHNYVQAGTDLQSAKYYFQLASVKMRECGVHHQLAWYWTEDNWAGTISMQDILDAMFEANAIEYHYFIGYIDAYRGNMWNLPFYTDFHSDLMRHFAK